MKSNSINKTKKIINKKNFVTDFFQTIISIVSFSFLKRENLKQISNLLKIEYSNLNIVRNKKKSQNIKIKELGKYEIDLNQLMNPKF